MGEGQEKLGVGADLVDYGLHGAGDVAEGSGVWVFQGAGSIGEVVGELLKRVAKGVKVPGDDGQVNRDRSGDRVTSFGLTG